MTPGNKIKQLRIKLKLEQAEFAESIGITRSWLNKIENDKTAVSDKIIASISEVYNVNLSEEKSTTGITNSISTGGKKIDVDQEKLIQRMCEFITNNAASIEVIKLELISLKAKITGESAAKLSVELDELIGKVEDGLWAEFAKKWS